MSETLAERAVQKDPEPDPVAEHNKLQMQMAMDALTEDLLADYIATHLMSRGAPVGRA